VLCKVGNKKKISCLYLRVMEEKKYSRGIGDKKTKKAVHQNNNDKKIWVKKEGMEHSNLGHQKPGCRTIPLFYTFISK